MTTLRKKVLDLCCGAGGLSYGFYGHKRFELLGGVDIDPTVLRSYRRNFRGTVGLAADVCVLGAQGVREVFGEVEVVVCGFPCQIYSSLGQRREKDERVKVLDGCLRLVEELRPEMVLLENVVGLVSYEGGGLFRGILRRLEEAGYSVCFEVLDAVDYGVPQMRKRLLIAGSRVGRFRFSRKYKRKMRTVREAWADLIGVGENDYVRWIRKGSDRLRDHEVAEHGEKVVAKIGSIRGFANAYKRLEFDKPSGTIVSSFGALSGPTCVHPVEDRALTVREAARLQSFPDKFRFYGSKTEKRRQVANAVPPLLSVELSRMMWRQMKRVVGEVSAGGRML